MFMQFGEAVILGLDAPEGLRRISARAAQLCRARHTWDHRMEVLAQVLCGKSEAASLAV